MYPTSSLRGLKRRLCFTGSQTPALSKQTCKAGSGWKLPTQGLAPSLPEPGKHETITEMRQGLKATVPKIKGSRIVKGLAKMTQKNLLRSKIQQTLKKEA